MFWCIWLELNERVFNSKFLPIIYILFKINHLLLLWWNAATEAKRAKLDDSITSVKRSLEFLETRARRTGNPGELITPPASG